MIKITANVKAMIKEMNTRKDTEANIMYEYKIASTNTRIGVIGQAELKRDYPRRGDASGASKATHLKSKDGVPFEYIVVKRMSQWYSKGLGNQCADEIAKYEQLFGTEAEDFICPIIKAYTTKSDHNDKNGTKGIDNIVIVAQKASHISNLERACRKAAMLNDTETERHIDIWSCEDAETRYERLKKWAEDNGMWDCVGNGGNSGVIYDYAKQCYKAVFVDYAL